MRADSLFLAGRCSARFRVFYAIVLNALYLPFTVMIFAVIFRDVAIEFREHSSPGSVHWHQDHVSGRLRIGS